MQTFGRTPRAPALLIVPLALVLLVAYLPSLPGGFVFDDDANIATIEFDPDNPTLTTLRQITFGNDSGPFGRPVAMLSFAIQIISTGLDPFPMKVVNLAIHSVLGLILFLLSRLVLGRLTDLSSTSRAWVSLTIAGAWLLHPFNLTSVAYIVQRMNGLSALFVALAVLVYTRERTRQQERVGAWLTVLPLIAILGVLAVLSKENALLLPVYLFVIEICLFGFAAARRLDAQVVRGLFVLLLGIPVAVVSVVLILDPVSVVGGYEGRAFTLVERALTEARVLVWYMGMLLVPNINQMTLYHDGLAFSTSLFDPPSTFFSILAIVSLLGAAIALRSRYPWFSFGIFWFFGGHLLESTIFPLELVYEHRNYLPGFGIILASVTGAALLWRRLRIPTRAQTALALVLLALLGVSTHSLAYRWSDAESAVILEAAHHPESPRANMFAGTAYGQLAKGTAVPEERDRLFALGEQHFAQAYTLTPNSANALFGWLFLYAERQQPTPDWLIADLELRLATGLIDATTVNGLHKLNLCQIRGQCRRADDEFLGIMDSAFSNPGVGTSLAQAVLRDLALFYSEKRKDPETAALISKRALELRDSPAVRLELAGYLAKSGRLERALRELEAVSSSDLLGRHTQEISQWREAIAQAQGEPKALP